MRKPRYYEVLLFLACTSFFVNNCFKGFDGFIGVGLALLLFAIFKYFEFMSER